MTGRIDNQRLDELDAITQAATPAPWAHTDSGAIVAPLTGIVIADVWEPSAATCNGDFIEAAREALPALVDEVRRLRNHIADLEAYALGCDGEGCTTPHSSWCEVGKKTAAANGGCTCPRPWKDSPQPHAGYCWLISPPRDEVERMRAQIARRDRQAARQTGASQ